ncbi:MAG: ATP-binding protein [Fervidicoccus sp.]|nr:MAG: ATP-binding protein [Fervidicoccus sp.]
MSQSKKDLRLRGSPSSKTEGATSKNEVDEYIERAKERLSSIPAKLMVMSGKGGVGKTFISVSLAQYLRKMGYRVALYDADETGASVPFFMGERKGEIFMDEETGELIPLLTDDGIQVMSIEPLLTDKSTPLIWQGSLRTKFILQTLAMTKWDDPHIMIIDLPPGTGDETITIAQYVPPLRFSLIVASPGKLANGIVRKAINFSKRLEVPIIGLVENMSYYVCPDGTKLSILGESIADSMAKDFEIEVLARIPLDESIRRAHDEGIPIYDIARGTNIDRELRGLAEKIASRVNLPKI